MRELKFSKGEWRDIPLIFICAGILYLASYASYELTRMILLWRQLEYITPAYKLIIDAQRGTTNFELIFIWVTYLLLCAFTWCLLWNYLKRREWKGG